LDKNKQNIINTIAQELDCGFDCYFNVKTEEIISIPGFSYILDMDDFNDAFEENFKKIETQKSDLIKFEVLQSFESFKIMEDFVAQLPDRNLKEELSIILIQKKPFRNFKNRIDHSDFRQNWFDFKLKEIEKKVETVLKSNNAGDPLLGN
jgi:hypothetical protein